MSRWRIFDGSAAEWDSALATLSGANFYQCHAWGEVKRRLGWQVLRLTNGAAPDGAPVPDAPIAAAQILLRRYPLGLVLVWLPGGVAGRVDNWSESFPGAVCQITNAKFAYIRLNALYLAGVQHAQTLQVAGWMRPSSPLNTGLSLRQDLASDEKTRLRNTSGNWRHNFKRSFKHGLEVSVWEAPDAAAMRAVYQVMETHKGLTQQVSTDELAAYVEHLGSQMILIRCVDSAGQTIALRACALFGDTAWDLLAAAAPAARKVYASHATLWALLEACAARGVINYDLGGIDPEGNKGVYDFKHGVGAERIEYLGEWDWASNRLVRAAANFAIRRRGARL